MSRDGSALRQRTIEVAGTRVAALETGDGSLVVLLHGFPDSAWTWEHQFEPLASAGYRVVAPFLPGYPPSAAPPSDEITIPEVLHIMAALVERLGSPAALVGHDWGATIAYSLAATRPGLLSGVAGLATAHPFASTAILGDPRLIRECFHQWFFQLPDLPEAAVAADDLAFIDFLWREWSPDLQDPQHLARVKRETLGVPGALRAAIDYYRSMFKMLTSGALDLPAVSVPALAIFGADDPFRAVGDGQEQFFTGHYRLETVPNAGHFLHRERPAEVTSLLVDWLSEVRG